MHLIALCEQQLRQVGIVLTRDARDQGTPLHRKISMCFGPYETTSDAPQW